MIGPRDESDIYNFLVLFVANISAQGQGQSIMFGGLSPGHGERGSASL